MQQKPKQNHELRNELCSLEQINLLERYSKDSMILEYLPRDGKKSLPQFVIFRPTFSMREENLDLCCVFFSKFCQNSTL